MNSEMKANWLKALRSGEYEQCKGRLRLGNGYCCVGVLCNISGQGKWMEGQILRNLQEYVYLGKRISYPIGPKLIDNVAVNDAIVNMNDGGKSFAEIADYLETNLQTVE